MARGDRMGNFPPTNGPVDKANDWPDAWGHERQRPPYPIDPGPGLVVARALACGGAMARLVIV